MAQRALGLLAWVVLRLSTCSALTTVYSPSTVTIDLDASPAQRWQPAIMAVLKQHSFEDSFLPVFAYHNRTLFDNITDEQYASLAASLEAHYPMETAELHGISSIFASLGYDVSFPYLAAWVWFHELAHSDAASDDLRASQGTPTF